ncbi:hypothetical protein CI1B_03400 [Bradyrhizobium ivorense]|uniref:Uncharacterized protein n=1 Tax=Bradyrhizobium ivorense TaxID=2511166 RepID=A0A508SSA7_9BRAD|nr:hypothetical protein [Bradyrhizobium ivorense]VIO65243.1 hypothetical protein CI1B_03400 [Bradyrhizobium ivorense]
MLNFPEISKLQTASRLFGVSDNETDSFRCQETLAVNRRSLEFTRASRSADHGLPLRGYFLTVGSVLAYLLMATGWVLPAQLPNRFAEPDPVRPSIRIHSGLKGPERVVIDTNQRLPASADKEIAAATSRPDHAPDASTGSDAPTDEDEVSPVTLPPGVRNSLAQSAVEDISRNFIALASPEITHKLSHLSAEKRHRAARRATPHGRCDSAPHSSCSDTFALTRLW